MQRPETPLSANDSEGSYDRRGVIAVIADAGRFLVIRRSRHVIAPGKLCFPGGGIEPGESERDALVRECREELGAEAKPLHRIWENVTPWNVHLAWWTAALTDPHALKPEPQEVEEVLWMTVDELAEAHDFLSSNEPFLALVRRREIIIDGIH